MFSSKTTGGVVTTILDYSTHAHVQRIYSEYISVGE